MDPGSPPGYRLVTIVSLSVDISQQEAVGNAAMLWFMTQDGAEYHSFLGFSATESKNIALKL